MVRVASVLSAECARLCQSRQPTRYQRAHAAHALDCSHEVPSLALLCVCVCALSALAGTPLYVSPSGDDSFDGVSSATPFVTLSRAIEAASNYTTAVIHVAPGTYSGLKNTELDVSSHSLVCDVAGECTIDAAGSQRAITCANASTLSMLSSPPTISGFTFKAGAGTNGGQGSMVQVGSARVAFVACTFAYATTNAVVVADDSAAVSFSNCTFSHNGLR